MLEGEMKDTTPEASLCDDQPLYHPSNAWRFGSDITAQPTLVPFEHPCVLCLSFWSLSVQYRVRRT